MDKIWSIRIDNKRSSKHSLKNSGFWSFAKLRPSKICAYTDSIYSLAQILNLKNGVGIDFVSSKETGYWKPYSVNSHSQIFSRIL